MNRAVFQIAICLTVSLLFPILAVDLQKEAIDPLLARELLSNDFESGSSSPWFDESPAKVNWRVETYSSPSEANSPAPRPAIGTSYLRATRNSELASGLAVFSSPIFAANPGDRVSFDFWIRSKRPEGNNLELVWVVGNNETILSGLSMFSTAANYEWRSESVEIPVSATTNGKLIFYGYCGSNLEDAIAMDNIIVESSTITTQAPGTNCVVLGASVGTLTSPNYPSNYPNNANLCWLITNAYYISIQFNDFATELGRDILRVYLGNTTSSELYAELSGTSRPNSISQYTGSMLFVFTSDSANTNSGFNIYYDVTKATTVTPRTTTPTWTNDFSSPSASCASCGGSYTSTYGVLSSPNYPNPYCDFLNCYYQIKVSPGYRIQLRFYDFSTEERYDEVKVYDGPTTNDRLLGTFSGNFSSFPLYVTSTSNQMVVLFTTDGSVQDIGWIAEYGLA